MAGRIVRTRPSVGQLFELGLFGNGWLGRKIAEELECSIALGVDIADADAVGRWLDNLEPKAIINAAGRAGPPTRLRGTAGVPQNIDWCNISEETRAMTRRSNVEGPRILGRQCAKRGIKVVHLSSGCLWNGPSLHEDTAWRETDEPKPVSFYAETKVEGEQELIEACGDQEPLIPRLRLPIDSDPNSRNLITKVAGNPRDKDNHPGYSEVMDVVNSVTVVDSLIFALDALIRDERSGIYHVTNPGAMSYRDFMDWYCELVDPSHKDEYEIVPEEEIFRLGRATDGRSSCILDTSKLQNEARIHLSNAHMAVRTCLQQYKRSLEE